MKAIKYTEYGPPDVLRFVAMEKPVPKEDEVLVKVQAVSLNAADWHLLTADVFLVRLMTGGLLKPKNTILGADIAGTVEAVGKNIMQIQPGDEVYGNIAGSDKGGLCEYVTVPERVLGLKPENLSFAQAAAVPMAAVTALQGLRDKGQIQSGQKVLINGASGGVGTYAVQIAKSFGAEVTAVCSTRNLEQARRLGADHVIDYTQEDFTQNEKKYDLILAANGYHPISAYKRTLTADGTYVMTGGSQAQIFQAILLGPLMSMGGGKKLSNLSEHANQKDLKFLKQLIETGKVIPMLDRCYPFDEAVAALQYLGEGHARGKVVISMETYDSPGEEVVEDDVFVLPELGA